MWSHITIQSIQYVQNMHRKHLRNKWGFIFQTFIWPKPCYINATFSLFPPSLHSNFFISPLRDCTNFFPLVFMHGSTFKVIEKQQHCLKAHVPQATHFLIDVRWIRGHVLSAVSGNTIPHVRGLTTRIKVSSPDNQLRLLAFTLQNKHITHMHEPPRNGALHNSLNKIFVFRLHTLWTI